MCSQSTTMEGKVKADQVHLGGKESVKVAGSRSRPARFDDRGIVLRKQCINVQDQKKIRRRLFS